jgi:hypothetical protein
MHQTDWKDASSLSQYTSSGSGDGMTEGNEPTVRSSVIRQDHPDTSRVGSNGRSGNASVQNYVSGLFYHEYTPTRRVERERC